jgi:hypothetical protein
LAFFLCLLESGFCCLGTSWCWWFWLTVFERLFYGCINSCDASCLLSGICNCITSLVLWCVFSKSLFLAFQQIALFDSLVVSFLSFGNAICGICKSSLALFICLLESGFCFLGASWCWWFWLTVCERLFYGCINSCDAICLLSGICNCITSLVLRCVLSKSLFLAFQQIALFDSLIVSFLSFGNAICGICKSSLAFLICLLESGFCCLGASWCWWFWLTVLEHLF